MGRQDEHPMDAQQVVMARSRALYENLRAYLVRRGTGPQPLPKLLTSWSASMLALDDIYIKKASYQRAGRPVPHGFIKDQISSLEIPDPDAFAILSALSPQQVSNQNTILRSTFYRAVIATVVVHSGRTIFLGSEPAVNQALDPLDGSVAMRLWDDSIDYKVDSRLDRRHATDFRQLCQQYGDAVIVNGFLRRAATEQLLQADERLANVLTIDDTPLQSEGYLRICNSQSGEALRSAYAESPKSRRRLI